MSLLSIFVRIQITLDRHSPILVTNDCSLPDPPHFSLLSTLPFNFFLFQVVITVRDIRPRLVEEADTMGIKVLVRTEPEATILFPTFWTMIPMMVSCVPDFRTMIQIRALSSYGFLNYELDECVLFPFYLSGL